jgi:hypothetical protein
MRPWTSIRIHGAKILTRGQQSAEASVLRRCRPFHYVTPELLHFFFFARPNGF